MQDRTLQRSYVKQAASRKNALNLREYPTPNRVNNINNNNNNNNNNMRTPQPRRYVHFEEDGTQYHYPRSNKNKNSSSSYRHSAVKGKRTRNNNNICDYEHSGQFCQFNHAIHDYTHLFDK